MVIVLMGVTGCGKTTVGEILAEQLGWEFYDADQFHPPANIAKMSKGIPLNDEDRLPWLEAISRVIVQSIEQNKNAIFACSALREKYRQILNKGSEIPVRFIYLKGTMELIKSRLEARKGHFMDPNLLPSQFATLEEPSPSSALYVDVAPTPAAIVSNIRRQLGF
jgi:gluconokinase